MAGNNKRKAAYKGKAHKKVRNNNIESVEPKVDEKDGDGQEGQYDVESVVDKREISGQIRYLIKWKDYDDSDNSWERLENLNCDELIEEYEENSKASQKSASKTSEPNSKVKKWVFMAGCVGMTALFAYVIHEMIVFRQRLLT